MNTFRFTTLTRCGKTDIIIQEAPTLESAKAKYQMHNALKHSPMQLLKIEARYDACGMTYWLPVR